MASTTETPTKVPPKRGGDHPTYGEFIGGSKMTDEYTLFTETMNYRFTTQCRNKKSTAAIEKSLREARDSNKEIKFNGNLEATAGLIMRLARRVSLLFSKNESKSMANKPSITFVMKRT